MESMAEKKEAIMDGHALLIEVRRRWRELKSLEEERREVAAKLYSISSPRLDIERVQGGRPHGLETKAEKLFEYYDRINAEYGAIYDMAMEVRRIIGKLPEPFDRLLLREYYLRGKSYGAIAAAYHLSKERVIAQTKEATARFCDFYEETKNENPRN